MSVRVIHVAVTVNDGMYAGPRSVWWEVAPRVFHVVSIVAGNYFPFKDTVRHRTEHGGMGLI